MSDKFFAWTIDTRSDEGRGFIGRYWWFSETPASIPVHMKGCRIALFETRELAREGLARVKRSFPKAAVVKVCISIQPQKLTKRALDAANRAAFKGSGSGDGVLSSPRQ